MAERIIDRKAEDMYIEDMVKYSIVVTRRRAHPEVRDGFKPVQRRTLYDMFIDKAFPGHPKKSAKITGHTIGDFHPHGDSSVYSAMEPLAQPWKCKVPLITPASEFGTIMGDDPPDQRYTEVQLSQFAMDCVFADLIKSEYAVNWLETFDYTNHEPEYLPVRVPLLLINGTFGIGVGTSNSNIPPHNLVEVLEATRALIRDQSADVVLIPDFCNKLNIVDADWKEISHTGYGKFSVYGIIETEEKNGHPVIHIRSLPDGISSEAITDKLNDMIEKKQLPMITDIAEASNNTNGIDIIITLKKGSDAKYVEEILYSKTDVRTKEYVNFFAIDDIEPSRWTYKDYLLHFIDFRATTKYRLYCDQFKINRTRAHKLETYIKVIESGKIDDIVKQIKKQKTIDNDALTEMLIKQLNITDIQAGFILATNISHLSLGYLKKYKEEYKELLSQQDHLKRAITDDGSIIMNEIDQELLEIEQKYGTPRLCNVVTESESSGIPQGTFKVVLTNKNFIRKLPESEKITSVRGDSPKFVFKIDNTQSLLLFDNKGKVFKLPVSKIPITDKSSMGIDIRILSKNLTADIIAMWPETTVIELAKMKDAVSLVVCTRENSIKRLELDDFLNVSVSGLLYTKLKNDTDEVTGITFANTDLDVVVYSNQKALRIPVVDIPLLKRNSVGSKAMDTDFDVEGVCVIDYTDQAIVVITEHGRINVISPLGLPTHKRARQGNSVIKLSSGDRIVGILSVDDRLLVRVIAANGCVDIQPSQFKMRSGVAAGEKIPGVQAPVMKCEWRVGN